MLAILIAVSSVATPQDTVVLTMDATARRALAASPAVAAAIGAVRAPRGLRAESRLPFPDNPVFEYGRTRREGVAGTTRDHDWSVSQRIDIAGQWLLRGDAAEARTRSADSRVTDVRRVVGLEARRSFVALSIAARRAALTDSAAVFGERLATFARRQFDAGEANRLELNAATLEAARARSAAERARAELVAAEADISRLLGLGRDSIPATGSLPRAPTLRWSSDSALQAIALRRRPDLQASSYAAEGAQRALGAAKRARFPDLTVAAVGGRESGTDQLLGVAVGVSIPLFQRQQGAIGAAEADREATVADLTGTQRTIRAEVVAAASRFRRAQSAEQRFAAEVLRAATENVTLTERALTEGEVSLTEILVLRTTAVNAQLEYLDVLRDASDAWLELAAAIAVEPTELETVLAAEAQP